MAPKEDTSESVKFLKIAFALIAAVILIILAKIYQPELQILPATIFGFYIAVILIKRSRRYSSSRFH